MKNHLLERKSTQEQFAKADQPSSSCCCLSLFLSLVFKYGNSQVQ